MQQVNITLVQLPEWGWHQEDPEEEAKLMGSLLKHGQIQNLIVRYLPSEKVYEIVDGRRRLSIMKQLAHQFPTVWVLDLGPITLAEAVKHALSLELAAPINYAELAQQVVLLEGDPDFLSLPMTVPWTAERIGYFKRLLTFDWSQYATGREQVDLWEDELPSYRPPDVYPSQAGLVVAPVAVAPEKVTVERKPRPPAAAPRTGDDGAAVRLAALATLAVAPNAAQPLNGLSLATKQVTLGDDFSMPMQSDWRPEAPPVLDGIDEIELDCETTGLKWWDGDRPVGMSIRLPDGRTQYLPWAHKMGGNLDEEVVKRWAQRELRGKRITNANSRFDNHMLYAWGVDVEAQGCIWADVQHYAALLDEYRKEYGLNILARDYLGQEKTGQDLDKNRMAEYHAGQVAAYACQDVNLVGQLKQVLIPLMDKEDLQRVRELECQVIYPVCEMERNAAHVDRGRLVHYTTECKRTLDELLFEVGREVGFQVNPDKNADLVKLFDHLGLAYPGRTEPSKTHPQGQPSFADALMEKVDHPLVQMVRKSGKLASVLSKFLMAYSEVVGADNRLRFALHQLRGDEYGTVRGRFSMAGSDRVLGKFGANLQQVMRVNSQRMAFGFAFNDSSHDDEIFLVRALFGAAPFVRDDGSDADHLSADAQSIEYRLAAHFAESEQLITAYAADTEKLRRGDLAGKWVDFHAVVGDVIRPYKDLSRNIIKNANFCLVYGGRQGTLARTLGVEKGESDQIYNVWHRMFPELSKLPKKAENLARSRGYVKTISGRRARFKTAEHMQWAHAAINYVIQGSAADIMKQKLVELHKERQYTGFLMRYTVHDEVDGDARKVESAERVREVLNRQTCKDFEGRELRVPIVWEVETGANWAVAH